MQQITKKELESIDIEPNKIKRLFRKAYWLFSVYIWPQHDSMVLTRNGRLMFNSKDKTTGRILHVWRNHEFIEMKETVELLVKEKIIEKPQEGIVVDVGGYIGMSSTGFLLNDMFSKSLAFEPSPENFRLLEKNVALNGLEEKISAYNIALSDEAGTLEFELSTKNYGDNRVRKVSSQGSYGEEERSVIDIKADTFDNFLKENPSIEQERIKFIWMDIQGHEANFIKGASKFLSEHKNIPVAMEFWPYAMERSGVIKEDFISNINDLYANFYIMNKLSDGSQEIKNIERYYDELLNSGDSSSGLNILLFN